MVFEKIGFKNGTRCAKFFNWPFSRVTCDFSELTEQIPNIFAWLIALIQASSIVTIFIKFGWKLTEQGHSKKDFQRPKKWNFFSFLNGHKEKVDGEVSKFYLIL